MEIIAKEIVYILNLLERWCEGMSGREGRWGEGGEEKEEGEERKVKFLHACSEHVAI